VIFLFVAGCADGPLVEKEAALDTGGGSTAVAFAPLGGSRDDVVALSPARGQVDVMVRDPDGWRAFGSFYAGGVPAEVVAAQIGGQPALLVRDDAGSVALLSSTAPHRLDFPIQVWRRMRNGQPVDTTPPAEAIAAADLDEDGSDDLLVASALGVVVVRQIAALAGANPEHPPPANGWRLDAGHPTAVGAADLDGDGQPDLLAADGDTLYTFVDHDGVFSASHVRLPSAARAIVTPSCAPLVVLDDGRLLRVGRDGSAPVLPELVPIARVATGGAALAVTSKSQIALYDACAKSGAAVLDGGGLAALAVTTGRLATLGSDGRSLAVYQVAN
jgi:hypothetical protein